MAVRASTTSHTDAGVEIRQEQLHARLLNGEFVPEEKALVSVLDRGFLYGDGLFETMRVVASQPFRWKEHMHRFRRGAEFLRIRVPYDAKAQRRFADELIARNAVRDCVLRVTLSRGSGPRGYSPQGAQTPTFVMTLQAAPAIDLQHPPRWRAIRSSFRMTANDPLNAFKTANKLTQVLARAEADAAGVDEVLLLNDRQEVVSASAANVLWVEGRSVCTPALKTGALPGVTRGVVFELCRSLEIAVREVSATFDQVRKAQGVFLTGSVVGIIEVSEIDTTPVRAAPLVAKLQAAYANKVRLDSPHGVEPR
jgi:aminodeoxychorismate lyase